MGLGRLNLCELRHHAATVAAESVDRPRAAAATIIRDAPEFQRLLKEVGAKIVSEPSSVGSTRSPAQLAVPMAAPVAR